MSILSGEKARELISNDNAAQAKLRAGYIKRHRLGGAMYWESSADRNGTGSLIGPIAGSFGKLDQSQNELSYPANQYANMVAGCWESKGGGN